eukprot:g1025.t1
MTSLRGPPTKGRPHMTSLRSPLRTFSACKCTKHNTRLCASVVIGYFISSHVLGHCAVRPARFLQEKDKLLGESKKNKVNDRWIFSWTCLARTQRTKDTHSHQCVMCISQAKTLTLVAVHLPQVVEDLKPQESCAVRFHLSRAHELQQEYSPAMRETFSPAIKPHYRRLNLDRTSDSVDLIPHDPSSYPNTTQHDSNPLLVSTESKTTIVENHEEIPLMTTPGCLLQPFSASRYELCSSFLEEKSHVNPSIRWALPFIPVVRRTYYKMQI